MLSIDEAAQASGVTAHTLRYYEKAGVLPPVGRNAGGQRRYSDDDLGWIRFVSLLKSTGMALSDIRRFVAAERRGAAGRPEKLAILSAHKASIQAKMAEMAAFLENLDDKIRYYGER